MILDDVQSWLEQSINFEKLPSSAKFSLETMTSLVAKHDNPQHAFKSIHVAGSKGKGSVCQFLASIIEQNCYSHGVYASPHIKSFAERVRTATGVFSDAVYKKAFKALKENHTHDEATWFEFVTLFSFLSFKHASVDWAIFETGLGGRLDATNVILPQLCIITPIELEHTEILGDSLEKIATEKAGIFKPGVSICSAKQAPEVRVILEKRAKDLNCLIYFVDDFFDKINYKIDGDIMSVRLLVKQKNQILDSEINIQQKMLGKVQADNVALAILAISILQLENKITLQYESIVKGISQATLLGRFTSINNPYDNSNKLRIILDGAHTEQSIKNVLSTYYEQSKCKANKKCNLLFACAADKDIQNIANVITTSSVMFDTVTLTLPGSFKQGNLDKTKNAFCTAIGTMKKKGTSNIRKLKITEDYTAAIENAIKNSYDKNADLLIIGSFYLVGEAYKCKKLS